MTKANSLFARGFRARTFIVLASLLALLFTTFSPAITAYAATNTTQTQTTTSTNTSTQPANTTSTSTSVEKQSESETCYNAAGPLSFFMCPLFEQIMKTINWLAGPDDSVLTSMLRVEPLQFNKDMGLQRAYNNVLNFANSLFIIVFLVIIFANFVSDFSFLDSYTIKNTLPRLIAAVILAQFGFLLCAIAIDIGNILGTFLPSIISHGVLGPNVPMPGLSDSVVGLLSFGNPNAVGGGTAAVTTALFGGGGGIVFLLLLIMSILVLFSLLLAFIYMVARNLILIMLVFAAPIAFLAFVLPGTQPFFFKWGKNLIRLVLMFPLVTVLITTAEIVSFMLLHPTFDPNVFTDDRFKLLIGGLVPFVALMMIPKCLKLSGDIMEVTAGVAGGYIAGKSTQAAKDAPGNRRDRTAATVDLDKADRITKAFAGGGVRALAFPNSAGSIRRLGNAKGRANDVYEKAAKHGTSEDLKNMVNSRDALARQAAAAQLGKSGKRKEIIEALENKKLTQNDMNAVNRDNYDAFKNMPDLREWNFDSSKGPLGVPQSYYETMSANNFYDAAPSIGSWLGEKVALDPRFPDRKSFQLTTTGPNDFRKKFSDSQMHDFLGDTRNRNKIGVDIRKEMINFAYKPSNTGDAHAQAIRTYLNNNNTWK